MVFAFKNVNIPIDETEINDFFKKFKSLSSNKINFQEFKTLFETEIINNQ